MPKGQVAWNKVTINIRKLKKDYLNKVPVAKIAKEYGVTVQTIYSRLKTLGITRSNSESHIGLTPWNKNTGNGRTLYRRLMAEKIGRPLKSEEVVHHIDGNRKNNDINNLQLFPSHSEHMKHHMNSDEARRRGAKGLMSRWKKAALKTVT